MKVLFLLWRRRKKDNLKTWVKSKKLASYMESWLMTTHNKGFFFTSFKFWYVHLVIWVPVMFFCQLLYRSLWKQHNFTIHNNIANNTTSPFTTTYAFTYVVLPLSIGYNLNSKMVGEMEAHNSSSAVEDLNCYLRKSRVCHAIKQSHGFEICWRTLLVTKVVSWLYGLQQH